MDLLRRAIARFGVDVSFLRYGETEPYAKARALVAGFGGSEEGESFDGRGRSSGVRRTLYLLSDSPPPAARDGRMLTSRDTLYPTRRERIADGLWRVIAATEAERSGDGL